MDRNVQVHLQREATAVAGAAAAGPGRKRADADGLGCSAAETPVVRLKIRERREALGFNRTSGDLRSRGHGRCRFREEIREVVALCSGAWPDEKAKPVKASIAWGLEMQCFVTY